MGQITNNPYKWWAFKLLGICTNSLFLLHLFISIMFVCYVFSEREVAVIFKDIYMFVFLTPYVFFYFLSDLGLFILLQFKQRRNVLLGTDYWLAFLLGIKYLLVTLLIVLALFILWLFSGSSTGHQYN